MPRSRPAVTELSLSQARRVALRAQGLDRRRASGVVAPTMRHLQQVIDRIGVIQIDSVNVLARAHLMPAYSRLGPYDVALMDRAAGRAPRRLVECWAHEASFVAPETYRLQGWRQRGYRRFAWGTIREVPQRYGAVVDEVRSLVAEHGPITASGLHQLLGSAHPRTSTDWGWNWSVAKRVLEFLFFTGEVTAARRNAAFERCYDLTERVLPPHVLAGPEPTDAEAVRGLVEVAARAHGIGTARCLADHFRIRDPAAVAVAIGELVDAGTLEPVRVRGWDRTTYLHRDASLPRRATGRSLLAPFDPLVFERRRLEDLFAMRYRIEIYVPAERRVHGYYVLPFLLGERFTARVDLKADRPARTLRVQSAHLEPDVGTGDRHETTHELGEELAVLAGWLGLDRVEVPDGAGGDLAASLREELTAV